MALSQIVALLTPVRFRVAERKCSGLFISSVSSRPSGSGVRIPPSVRCYAEVTKRSNVRDSRKNTTPEHDGLFFFISHDHVAEWLTRLTANQFLSGAQVRVLPWSRSKVAQFSVYSFISAKKNIGENAICFGYFSFSTSHIVVVTCMGEQEFPLRLRFDS